MIRIGAVGALLDIYEQAIADLKQIIEHTSNDLLTTIVDIETTDENSRSIQTILSHIVNCGYSYAINIYNLKGHNTKAPDKIFHSTIEGYLTDLTDFFTYTQTILSEITDNDLEQIDNSLKIKTSWGQLYDIEQMIEHAIVHILRHKRQVENIVHLRLG